MRTKAAVKHFKKTLAFFLIVSVTPTQFSYAADPRAMLAAQKKYFTDAEEERESRRSAEQFARAEAAKLAMIDKQNFLLSNSGPVVQGGKKGAGDSPSPDLSDHADYESVRDLDPIQEEPKEQYTSTDFLGAILDGSYLVSLKDHPFVKKIEERARQIFQSVSYEVLRVVSTATSYGVYSLPYFNSPSTYQDILPGDPIQLIAKKFPYMLAASHTIGASGIFYELARELEENLTSFFFSTDESTAAYRALGAVAYTTGRLNAVAPVSDYRDWVGDKWGTAEHAQFEYFRFNEAYFDPHIYNDAASRAARLEFLNNKNYEPLYNLYAPVSTYSKSYAGAEFGSEGTLLAVRAELAARNFSESLKAANEEYEKSAKSAADRSQYLASLAASRRQYATAARQLGDSYSDLYERIITSSFEERIGLGVGEVTLGGNTGGFYSYGFYSHLTDAVGNRFFPDFVNLDFSLNRGRSPMLDAYLSRKTLWYRKEGTQLIPTHDKYADFSSLSLTQPGLRVVKTVETGRNTLWSFYDTATGALVLSVTVPGSANLNSNPLGFTDTVVTREHFELGRVTRIEILNTTDGSQVTILPRAGQERVVYNLNGQIVDGEVLNQSNIENPDKGFRITMQGGKVTDVYIGDESLFGSYAVVDSNGAPAEAGAKHDINKMIRDALKYSQFNLDNYNLLSLFLRDIGKGLGLKGQLSILDLISTTFQNDSVRRTRLQAGFLYSDKETASNTKYNQTLINFSPFAIDSGIPLTMLEGQYGLEKQILQTPLLGIPSIGIFGSLKGALQPLTEKRGDAKGGIYQDSSDDNMGVKTLTFIEQSLDGNTWVGMKQTVTDTQADTFFSSEYKMRLVLTEEEAEKSAEGKISYLLGKMLAGLYSEQGARTVTFDDKVLLQNFFVSKTVEMISSLYAKADKMIRKLIDDFNESFNGSRLGDIFHTLIHAVPVVTRHITMPDRNSGALHLYSQSIAREYSILPQMPVDLGVAAFNIFYNLLH